MVKFKYSKILTHLLLMIHDHWSVGLQKILEIRVWTLMAKFEFIESHFQVSTSLLDLWKKSWNQWSISNTSSSQFFFSEKKKEFMTWNFCQLKKQFSRFIRNLILAVWNLCNIYNEWFCNEFLCAKKSLNSAEKKLFSIKICCISKRFWKETLSVKLVIIQKIDNVKKLHFCEGPPSPNHKSSSWKLKKNV